jgi:hypothetical protein
MSNLLSFLKLLIFKAANLKLPKSELSVKFLIYNLELPGSKLSRHSSRQSLQADAGRPRSLPYIS